VKKCCKLQRTVSQYTVQDRMALFEELDFFIDELFQAEEEEAYDEFWGAFLGREDELTPELLRLSEDVQFMSFACDHEIGPGKTVIDLLLEQHPSLSLGARAFASAIRRSTMRLYEAIYVVPGVSITLRDVLEGGTVTVAERTASKTLNQFDWVAARVVERGPSGRPEMERGVLAVPRLYQQSLLARLTQMRAAAVAEGDRASFYADLPLLFHEVWVGSLLEPRIPVVHNTDGEPLLITRVHFEVRDQARLESVLDAQAELSRADDRWSWSGKNAKGAVVSLGSFELEKGTLVLEANSKERAERGMQLLSEAGDAVSHRATTHEDPERSVRDGVKAQALGKIAFGAPPEEKAPKIPPAIAEALVLDHYAKHYRSWIDEPVPALDGETPRAAAKKPAMRARVVELIQGLESMYQQSLRKAHPAYDPSWMWAELGLKAQAEKLPPPLPHERLGQFIDGAEKVIVEVAEAVRGRPGFDDTSSVLHRDACRESLDIRRLLKEHEAVADSADGPSWQGRELTPYVDLALNFALHRRKVFWVDEALTFMLAQTDIDIPASDLRAPFASFAIVFTDRHVLSLGERLLSKRAGSALAGLILRVATVYVTERHEEVGRTLDLCFAFDALGDDLPELVQHTLRVADDSPVQSLFPQDDLVLLLEPPLKTTTPLHGLLQVVVNAMLYATSSGVEPEVRAGAPRPAATARPRGGRVFTSENVFFLPGSIDISHLRKLEELSRVGEGREVLRRCMVRGHWRRAAKSWSDQRLRWIAPYWKGPDMAAVIERAYRLKS
jgi:hypothetical protein